MIVSFPGPVLVMSPEVMMQLETGDVLPGLWTLFTKCKASLQDGNRLENISWRLWYREITAAKGCTPPTPQSLSPAPSEKSGTTADSLLFTTGQLTRRSDDLSAMRDSRSPPVQSRTNSRSPPQIDDPYIKNSEFSFRRPRSVGKLICDIIPHQVTFPPAAKRPSVNQSLPTPTSEYFPTPALLPTTTTTEAISVVPAIHLPSTSPDRVAPCPRVVVVNPTPNPSPHPTPPATPVFPVMSTTSISHASMSNLLPPPLPLPALTVVTKQPTASSLTSSRPAQLPRSPPRPPHPVPDPTGPVNRPPSSTDLQVDDLETASGGRLCSDRASSASSSRKVVPPAGNKKSSHPPAGPSRGRKGKEVTRHIVTRTRNAHIGRPTQIRRAATHDGKIRPTFNIGSMSSGSKSVERAAREHDTKPAAPKVISASPICEPPPPPPPPPPPHSEDRVPSKLENPPTPLLQPTQRRRVVVANTSSEYETTDTDDGSWAEDDINVEEVAKMSKEEARIRDAALEAKRQRDMFAKIPKRSYSNLNRTKSGLLTQLLNPDPSIFPPNHPYRTSFSSQDLPRLPKDARAFAQPILHTSKSAVALPQAAAVTAHVGSANVNQSGPAVGQGYRPKGRPQNQEMEDDSDTEDEHPENSVQLSRSVAQERLAALVGMHRSNNSTSISSSTAYSNMTVTTTTTTNSTAVLSEVLPDRSDKPTTAVTAPIPLSHPYNLPAPALPSTPRTTRRQMLQTELSESLRRNLLWERQVSKVSLMGGMRRQSSGGTVGGLRPLTALNGNANTSGAGGQQAPARQPQQGIVRHRSWADDFHTKGW